MNKRPFRALVCCALASFVFALDANAAPGFLRFDRIRVETRQRVDYSCDGGKSLRVIYVNTMNGQSFATLHVGPTPLVFVNVIAASGAKYVAQQYTWWTKGERGDLYDAQRGEQGPPLLANCTAAPRSRTSGGVGVIK
jgi:membrane-bound inhibitor of C-type lysozyme